jgi:predicted site-specific integrase-resolvase
MSLLTILEASKKFNIGRTTIYKAIKKGELTPKLSESGVQMLDPQDMVRLFGSSSKKPVSVDSKSNVSVNNDDLVRELRLQIEELKQDKVFLKQEIASVRNDFDDFKLLIEYKVKTDVPETGETVAKQNVSSFEEQKKQDEKQVETKPEIEQNRNMMSSLLSRLLKLR